MRFTAGIIMLVATCSADQSWIDNLPDIQTGWKVHPKIGGRGDHNLNHTKEHVYYEVVERHLKSSNGMSGRIHRCEIKDDEHEVDENSREASKWSHLHAAIDKIWRYATLNSSPDGIDDTVRQKALELMSAVKRNDHIQATLREFLIAIGFANDERIDLDVSQPIQPAPTHQDELAMIPYCPSFRFSDQRLEAAEKAGPPILNLETQLIQKAIQILERKYHKMRSEMALYLTWDHSMYMKAKGKAQRILEKLNANENRLNKCLPDRIQRGITVWKLRSAPKVVAPTESERKDNVRLARESYRRWIKIINEKIRCLPVFEALTRTQRRQLRKHIKTRERYEKYLAKIDSIAIE